MNYKQTFYVERDNEEVVLEVEFDVYPLVRGRYDGPPENCYPDEGGYAEITNVFVDSKKRVLWDDELTRDEEIRISEEAYENCMLEAREELADRHIEDW